MKKILLFLLLLPTLIHAQTSVQHPIGNLSAITGIKGEIGYDTVTNKLMIFNGISWKVPVFTFDTSSIVILNKVAFGAGAALDTPLTTTLAVTETQSGIHPQLKLHAGVGAGYPILSFSDNNVGGQKWSFEAGRNSLFDFATSVHGIYYTLDSNGNMVYIDTIRAGALLANNVRVLTLSDSVNLYATPRTAKNIADTEINHTMFNSGGLISTGNVGAEKINTWKGTSSGGSDHRIMQDSAFFSRISEGLIGSETGSNAGSNWYVERYADDGSTFLGSFLIGNRSTGVVDFGHIPTVSGVVMFTQSDTTSKLVTATTLKDSNIVLRGLISSGGGGGGSYILNQTFQQTSANLNIDGIGTFGGRVTAGTIATANLANTSSNNNASVQPTSNGVEIFRNVADSHPILQVQNLNASSTGDLLQLLNSAGTKVGAFDNTGNLTILNMGHTSATNDSLVIANTGGKQQKLGFVPVAMGGTGTTSLNSNSILFGQGTGPILALSLNTTGTTKFLSQVSSFSPQWSTLSYSDLPILYSAAANLTSLSGAQTITSFSSPNTSTYRVGGYLNIVSVTTDVIQMQIIYTDENGNTGVNKLMYEPGTTAAGLSAIGNYNFCTRDIRVQSGSTITISTTLTTSLGSISYDAGATITPLN